MYLSCRFKKFGAGLGVVLVSLFACSLAKAVSSISLDWTPNTDPSVAGYNVYYGGTSHSYTSLLNAGNVTNTTVGGLAEGKTYYFAVTAYTFDGLESDYSAEYVYLVPGILTMTRGATPDAPLQVRFPVVAGHSYELQFSTNLRDWNTVWQTTGVSNVWVEYDSPITGSGPQFYRLVLH
jgi:hypothetical protein